MKIEKQKSAYSKLDKVLNFLTNENLNDKEIWLHAIKLIEAHPSHLETKFFNEFLILLKC